MHTKNVKLVYFSPTRTSHTIVQGIANGMNTESVEHIDLTLPSHDSEEIVFSENDFVIFGMPVYSGRIPSEAVTRLQRFRGNNTLAAIVVVYGNRAYEDALLELKNITADSGCIPVAAGAFIGEHSFSQEKFPIAQGRPDKDDILETKAFGKKISNKIQSLDGINHITPIDVPGNFPYRDGIAPSKAAASTNTLLCAMCETCGTVCPTGAITSTDVMVTDNDKCILCCACIKSCPTQARELTPPPLLEITQWLSENFKKQKKAEIFI